MLNKTIPTLILGGSGYVSGELIRLVIGHPALRLEAVISGSHSGERLDSVFPHFAGGSDDLCFGNMETARAVLENCRQLAVFCALPHGETAQTVAELFEDAGDAVRLVDMSADFRLGDAEKFASTYGRTHGAPQLLPKFACVLPDLTSGVPSDWISHPGCFTTCVTLGAAPLVHHLVDDSLVVSAVTGSTGAGRQPKAGTHHPERQSALWAYEPLRHRHVNEMEKLLGTRIQFVPHSGPFSRGIHATIFGRLARPISTEELIEDYKERYASSPFISVGTRLPSVKEIVGSNRCHIGISTLDDHVVVTSVIDNLVKGAAGGAVQWMNRLFALDEGAGLMAPMPGWI